MITTLFLHTYIHHFWTKSCSLKQLNKQRNVPIEMQVRLGDKFYLLANMIDTVRQSGVVIMLVPLGLIAGNVAQVARLLAGIMRGVTLSFGICRNCVVGREPVGCRMTRSRRDVACHSTTHSKLN